MILRSISQRWQVHYIFFARAGFTEAARTEAETVGAQLVNLEKTLDADLRRASVGDGRRV